MLEFIKDLVVTRKYYVSEYQIENTGPNLFKRRITKL